MRYYRRDLDQISPPSLFPVSPSCPVGRPVTPLALSAEAGLKIGGELKAVVRTRGDRLGGSGSNESMKNNTCPGPAAKIVNAPRYIRRQKGSSGTTSDGGGEGICIEEERRG